MSQIPWSQIVGPDWGSGQFNERLHATLSAELQFDALLWGVVRVGVPRLDEFLLVDRVRREQLRAWCQRCREGDESLLGRCVERIALLSDSPLDSPVDAPHAMVVSVCETLAMDQYWTLIAFRHDRPFDQREARFAQLVLRTWQAALHQPAEVGLNQLLLGSDRRVIVTDLATQRQVYSRPDYLDGLADRLFDTMQQRYPDLRVGESADLALQVRGELKWLCLRWCRAVEDVQAMGLWVQIRPMDQDELPPVEKLEDDRIAEALAFMHRGYADSPSLARVAGHVHMSPFHFHRLFTRQVGVSPKQYLQRKQLQIAKWHLRRGTLPISRIARVAGFTSHGHFTSTFHRLTGQSPSTFRQSWMDRSNIEA